MHEYSKEEIEAILKATKITYEESGLQGAKVYHGTSLSQELSVVGGAKNIGNGLGGCGLYLSVGNRNLSARYAKEKASAALEEELILEGYLNPNRDFRIGRVVVTRGMQLGKATTGRFQSNWLQSNPSLQAIMLEHFDIIDLNIETSLGALRVLVMHESAGKDAVQWVGHHKFPVGFPRSFHANQLQILGYPNYSLAPLNQDLLPYTPKYSSSTRYHGSNIKHVYCEYNGPVRINGQSQHVRMWTTKIYERLNNGGFVFKQSINTGYEILPQIRYQAPLRLPFHQKIIFGGKQILKFGKLVLAPVCLFVDINHVYQLDPDRNPSRAIIRGGSRWGVQTGAHIGVFLISGPLGLMYCGASLATSLTPEESDAEVQKHIDYLNTTLGPVTASYSTGNIRLGHMITQGMRALQRKLDEIGDKIANSSAGKAAEKLVEKNINHFVQQTQKGQPIFFAVPGASCPVLIYPSKEQQKEKSKPTANSQAITTNTPKDNKEPLSNLFDSVDPTPSALQMTPFGLPGSNPIMTIQDGVVTNVEGAFSHHLGMSQTPLHQELQTSQHDLTLNQPAIKMPIIENQDDSKMNNYLSVTSYGDNNKSGEEDKITIPAIRNIRPTATSDGVGVAATVGATGTISAVIGKKGLVITLEALFDSQFWTTFGVGLGIGSALAGAILIGQYFWNAHLKRIENKIQRLIKHSRKDNEFISNKISNLMTKYNALHSGSVSDYESLLGEITALINLVNEKINKEDERAEKAHDLRGKAAKPHALLGRDYKETLSNLTDMKLHLELEYKREKFIEDNKQKSPIELITLAQQVTNQKIFKNENAAEIDGLRQLIGAQIIKFASHGEIEKAQALIAQLSGMSYYKPGNVKELKFDFLLGVVDSKTQGVINPINQRVDEINRCVGSGGDPKSLINALIDYIKNDAKVVENFEHRRHNRHHANKNASVNYVSKAQWNGRITEVNNFVTYLESVLKQYENGNQPVGLELEKLSGVLLDLQNHQDEPVSYWLEQLKNNQTTQNEIPTQEVRLLQVFASNQVVNDAFSNAVHGKFEDAKTILVELKKISSEHNELADKMINAFDKLIPFANEGTDFWCHQLKTLVDTNHDKKDIEFVLAAAIANRLTLNAVLKNAGQRDFQSAKEALLKFKEANPDNIELVNILTGHLEFAEQHDHEDSTFWFDQLTEIETSSQKIVDQKAKDKSNLSDISVDLENKQNTHAETENIVKKCISIGNIQNCSKRRSDLGYFREGANILKDLKKRVNDLELDSNINKLIFVHNGQMISTFVKPIQGIISRYINGLTPSTKKDIAMGGLEAVNTMQMFAPNCMTLAIQGVHARYKGETSIFKENAKEVLTQLWKDVKTPISYNGFMLYQQAFLKSLQVLPIEKVLPTHRRSTYKRFKDTTLVYGNLISQSLSAGNSVYQFAKTGIQAANLPQNIFTLGTFVFDYGKEKYHQYKQERGEGIEDPAYYINESTFSPALGGITATWFMTRINGGANRWTFAIGLASLLYTFYHYTSQATKNDSSSKALSKAMANIQFHSQLKALHQYVMNAEYKIILGEVSEEQLSNVKSGKEILFVCEKKKSDKDKKCINIYFIGKQKNSYERKELIESHHDVVHSYATTLSQHFSKDTSCIITEAAMCKSITRFYVLPKDMPEEDINHCILSSRNNIQKILENTFNGLGFNKDQEDVVNDARSTLFYHEIKDAYDKKKFDEVLAATCKKEQNKKVMLSNTYQLPPHLAWQVIVSFRLAHYAESKDLLSEFRSQYEEYSQYIYESAPTHWSDTYWEFVKEELKRVLQFALQQFVIAANESESKEEKLNYLSFITHHYRYQDEWYELLRDELKFWAAYEYNKLGDTTNARLFLENITDLPKLLREKNKVKNFSHDVLTLLAELDNAKHTKMLLLTNCEEYGITEEVINNQMQILFQLEKYEDLLLYLNQAREFNGKYYYLALATFAKSNDTAILESLKYLLNENNKDTVQYWSLFYHILVRCLDSIRYCPNEKARSEYGIKLFCLTKICIDKIQKFPISEELKQETIDVGRVANEYIRNYLQNDDEIQTLIDYGHRCMRGENGVNIISAVESILGGFSYEFVEEGIRKKYLPLDVPPDNDCVFHVFGITRKKGIELLRKHIANPNFLSNKLFGNSQRKDVIEILLNDLEIKNNTKYDRSEKSFSANLKLLDNYLTELAKPGTWMPHNQQGQSVLDALALLLSKNLRVFITSENSELAVASEMIHDATFETIEMLLTSAEGFCYDQKKFNHYIHLKYLPFQCEEVLDNRRTQKMDVSAPHSAFFKSSYSSTPRDEVQDRADCGFLMKKN